MKYVLYMDSPVGALGIVENGEQITEILFGGRAVYEKRPGQDLKEEETMLLGQAAFQLSEYFAGIRKKFELPLFPEGTEFQQKVWNALLEIPYGELRTYGEIAAAIGSPKSSRAVGMANHNNPIPIIIPCHRVIGAGGALTGYGGGLDIKRRLLELEGSL